MKFRIEYEENEMKLTNKILPDQEQPTNPTEITGRFGYIKFDGKNIFEMKIETDCIESMYETVIEPVISIIKSVVSLYKGWAMQWFGDMKVETEEHKEQESTETEKSFDIDNDPEKTYVQG